MEENAGGGRPRFRAAIDVGGTKIIYGVFDGEMKLRASSEARISDTQDFAGDAALAIRKLLEGLDSDAGDLECVGICVPGTVDPTGRFILKTANLTGLPRDLAEKIERGLGVRTYVMRDASAAALGELRSAGAPNAKNLICFSLGTGIGAGMIIDGKVYDGGLNAAGEIGHVPLVSEGGRKCGCGKSGCLEKYVSGLGMSITASETFGRRISSEELFALAEEDNAIANGIIDEAVENLGKAIVSSVNLLSPERVVFAGGLSERERFVEPLVSYVLAHSYDSGGACRVSKAALGRLAPLFGTAYHYDAIVSGESGRWMAGTIGPRR